MGAVIMTSKPSNGLYSFLGKNMAMFASVICKISEHL